MILGTSFVQTHKTILYFAPINLKTYCSIFLKGSSVLIEFLNYYDYDKDVENKKLQVHFTLLDVMSMICQTVYVQLYLGMFSFPLIVYYFPETLWATVTSLLASAHVLVSTNFSCEML